MPDRPHAAADAMLARGLEAPLIGLLGGLVTWIEDRLIEEMHAAGFDDVRPAHNAVFALLPDGGIRLTDLAAHADMSKQAMGELVADLESKAYLRRQPDPADGRAKLILWDERGMQAHAVAMAAFARIEGGLRDLVGAPRMAALRESLATLALAVRTAPDAG